MFFLDGIPISLTRTFERSKTHLFPIFATNKIKGSSAAKQTGKHGFMIFVIPIANAIVIRVRGFPQMVRWP